MATNDQTKLHELTPPHMKKKTAEKPKSQTPAAPKAPEEKKAGS